MAGFIIISMVFISCAILLWFIADKRGANTFFWAFMGAFFGPLAIPFVFFTKKILPKLSDQTNLDDELR